MSRKKIEEDPIFLNENPNNISSRMIEEKHDKEGTNEGYDQHNVRRSKEHFFADEIKIGEQIIFTIDLQHQFRDEENKQRVTKWGERPERKRKQQQNVVFNPYHLLFGNQPLLTMDPNQSVVQPSTQPLFPPYNPNATQQPFEKRMSRWGLEHEKTFHPPCLHYIPRELNQDDLEYLVRIYRLDEINNRQQYQTETILDDLDCRSPSPDPVYNAKGERINTRDHRQKESMYREKNNLIEECIRIKKTFVPPSDYKPHKKHKKIYMGVAHSMLENPNEHTQLIGKILGPKGNTQRRLEQQSGCKISIRGKGSGRIRKDFNDDDQLHVLLQANTDEQIENGVQLIEKILKGEYEEANKPTNQNILISYIVNSDQCDNCHEKGHKTWACPLAMTKAKVKCEICGETSHVSRDCIMENDRVDLIKRGVQNKLQNQNIEQEFGDFLQNVEGGLQNAQSLMNYASNKIIDKTGYRALVKTQFITDSIDPTQYMKALTYFQDPQEQSQHQYSSSTQQKRSVTMNLGAAKNYDKKSQQLKLNSFTSPLYNPKALSSLSRQQFSSSKKITDQDALSQYSYKQQEEFQENLQQIETNNYFSVQELELKLQRDFKKKFEEIQQRHEDQLEDQKLQLLRRLKESKIKTHLEYESKLKQKNIEFQEQLLSYKSQIKKLQETQEELNKKNKSLENERNKYINLYGTTFSKLQLFQQSKSQANLIVPKSNNNNNAIQNFPQNENIINEEKLIQSNLHNMSKIQELIAQNKKVQQQNEKYKQKYEELADNYTNLCNQIKNNENIVIQKLNAIDAAIQVDKNKLDQENKTLKKSVIEYEDFIAKTYVHDYMENLTNSVVKGQFY